MVLPKEGRDLLDSHTLERDDGDSQAFYAGVSRSREIDHDSNLYATCLPGSRHVGAKRRVTTLRPRSSSASRCSAYAWNQEVA